MGKTPTSTNYVKLNYKNCLYRNKFVTGSGKKAILEQATITRMFCEHQTFANFAMVDQFATIKSAKPKLLLVNTHNPCQDAIVRSQRIKFSADLAHSQRF